MTIRFLRALPALLLLALAGHATAQSASPAAPPPAETRTAIFAGGCFWCTESDFDKVPGVIETVSGYTGGRTANPTYEQVGNGGTGHYEAVKVTYDPARVTYPQLVEYYWRTVDPVDAGGQFCDRGESYRTAIFVATPEERAAAEASAKALAASGKLPGPIVTPILDARTFYPAEGYHQDYKKLNTLKYTYYRSRCGRDARLEKLWGDAAGKWPVVAAGS
jgi:peptide-methionine (S)-S-oxide reductase